MNPDEFKKKRGRGRPKKTEVKAEKTKAKKTVAASKPKVTRVAVKSPAELI